MRRLLQTSRRLLLAAVALHAAASAGCCPHPKASWYVERPPEGKVEPLTDGGPDTYAGYIYAMNYSDRVAFSRAVASLKLGEPVSRVVQVLGEPNDAGYTVGAAPFVHQRFYLSYEVAWETHRPAEMPKSVAFYFNLYGYLERVRSFYPGVADRTAVAADCIAYCLCPLPPLPPHRDSSVPSPPPVTGPSSAPSIAAAFARP